MASQALFEGALGRCCCKVYISISLSLSFPLFVVVGGDDAAFADVAFCISPPPLASLHNASSIVGGDELKPGVMKCLY